MFWGAVRSSCVFPFEHSLELMKLKVQAMLQASSSEVIKEIIRERGLLGFSDTALANLPRRLLREVVRRLVIGYTHELLIKQFSEIFTKE